MKKFISITLILSIILSISCWFNVFANVKYYPECSLLPRYDSLGYRVSTYGRDENQILRLENGLDAYVLQCTASDGQAYIQRLISNYGWRKVATSSQNNTGYNVLQKEDNYIGIAVFYGPASSADYIHIYPKLDSNYSEKEPVFYNEYSELPMLSLYASTQYIHRFKTPEDMIGYTYKDCYTVDYMWSIIEDIYGWKESESIQFEQGHGHIYTKNNAKICLANLNDDYTYIFGFKNQLAASDLSNYINYAKQYQEKESKSIYGNPQPITGYDNGITKGIDHYNKGLYYEAINEIQRFCDENWYYMTAEQQKNALYYLNNAKSKLADYSFTTGKNYYNKGLYYEAQKEFTNAVDLYTKNTSQWQSANDYLYNANQRIKEWENRNTYTPSKSSSPSYYYNTFDNSSAPLYDSVTGKHRSGTSLMNGGGGWIYKYNYYSDQQKMIYDIGKYMDTLVDVGYVLIKEDSSSVLGWLNYDFRKGNERVYILIMANENKVHIQVYDK